nr:FtsQ-type POTRA domain-containing protein [Microbacterium bovistercoris]
MRRPSPLPAAPRAERPREPKQSTERSPSAPSSTDPGSPASERLERTAVDPSDRHRAAPVIPLADARSDASASDASSPPVAGPAASRPTASDPTASDPTASDPTASDPTASGRATSADADPDRDVGVRDVWKAARARRRALRAEMRRFTVQQRRRRTIWITVAAAIVLLVAGSFGAAYSPLFAVETINVVGTRSLDAGEVEHALSGQLGTPLPSVDAGEVKAALVAFPLVQSYSLEARPPHELVVRIVERTPVGVIKGPAGYTLVDAAGVALATTATAPKGQPTITVGAGTTSEAFRAAGQVVRSLPASIRTKVTAVTATTPDDVTLTLGGTGSKIRWGSADDSAMKALVLQKLMKGKPASKTSFYDVSSPRAVVVR